MFVETVQGAVALSKLYEQRSTLVSLFGELKSHVLKTRKTIVVFGPGGTGKTTFGTLLSGKLDTDNGAKDYRETTEVENFSLSGKLHGTAIIAPGQEWRRPSSWGELYRSVTNRDSTIIVNVVAHGYHATELEKSHLLPNGTASSNDDLLRKQWFDIGRQKEIKAFQEIVPHLKNAPGNLRIITLVNKQDLWWHDRSDVKAFYESGPYAKLIKEISDNRGEANFRHELVSAALVEHNLRTADGFIIAPTASGYDDALRVANLEKASITINAMITR